MRPLTAAILYTLLAIAAYSQTTSDPYTWTPVIPALTVPRADACAAALADGSALVSGGITADGSALPSVDLFQLGTGFSSAQAMNNARAAHSCTTLKDGRILVAGGNDGHGNPIGTAEIYNPSDQSWTVVANLNDPRWGHTATLLKNGRVLIAGGQDGGGPKDTLELFEPKASAFIPVPVRLSSPRMNLAAALLPGDPDNPDGFVAIMGGMNFAGASASVDLFNPAKNTLTAAAPLLTARASHTASTLSDGTVLVAGGWDGTQDINTAEVYDVQKGSVSSLGNLNTPRHGHFSIALPGNGNVLVGAGWAGSSPLASCELYSPAEGTFSTIGSLASPRARTTAVPVAGGMVLSAGGVSTDGVTPISGTGVLPAPTLTWNLTGFTDPYKGSFNVHGRNFGAKQQVTLGVGFSNIKESSFEALDPITTNFSDFDVVTSRVSTPVRSGNWTLVAQTSLNSPQVTAMQPVIFAHVDLTSSCNPCTFGQTATQAARINNSDPTLIKATPAGGDAIAFMDGNTIIGAASLNAASSVATSSFALPPGAHPITASIGATAGGFGGTADGFVGQSSALNLTVNTVPTTVSVSATPDPVFVGNTVTINAVVSFSKSQLPASMQGTTPTGTITYTIGSLTVAAFVGNPITFQAPAVGNYMVTAKYGGDAFFTPSTSLPANLIVSAFSATWTPLTTQQPSLAHMTNVMVLLTDGRPMIQSADDFESWFILTPDANGSYANGTWTTTAPMSVVRLDFASQVLPNGKVFVLGGENTAVTGGPFIGNEAATGEIYDPVANTWTPIPPIPNTTNCPSTNTISANVTSGSNMLTNVYPQTIGLLGLTLSGTGIPTGATVTKIIDRATIQISAPATATNNHVAIATSPAYMLPACFGDTESMLVPGGTAGQILLGSILSPEAFLYDIATNTYSQTGSKLHNDISGEEGWAKLSDGSILCYDLSASLNQSKFLAERYIPSTGKWVDASTVNGTMPPLATFTEMGPIVRLQDGRALVLGQTGNTALYIPSTNTWSAGPVITGTLNGNPATFGTDDSSAAILPNGHVLFTADSTPSAAPAQYVPPTQIFDFNPSTNTISPASPALNDPNLLTSSSSNTSMLMLPTGQVLFHDSFQVFIYTPVGGASVEFLPVINNIAYNGNGMFTLTGTQLNGQNAGAAYGDDSQMDSNYPIVLMTNSAGNVFYAKTTNWSNFNVGISSAAETVNFTLNPNLKTPGNYSVVVSGAGIQSFPVTFTITQAMILSQ